MRDLEETVLASDELEALRLADLEGLSHEEAAERMGVSRPTFGRIVANARAVVADALTGGKALRIERPEYVEVALRRECPHHGGRGKRRCEE